MPCRTLAVGVLAGWIGPADATPAPPLSACTDDGPPGVERLLIGLPVADAQLIAQQTPIAARADRVAIANIEPAEPASDAPWGLTTVLRIAERDGAGCWSWTAHTLDERTLDDPWHTPPGVGLDAGGRVHVAWNMHNFPWQYGFSADADAPGDIEFAGERIDDEALRKAVEENSTSFPHPGRAAIPGTQVTYPAFFNDRDGTLHVTYRFAAKPARRFAERTMSAGVARHGPRPGRWHAIGGSVALADGDAEAPGWWRRAPAEPVAVAAETGWTLYHPRLGFGGGTTHLTLHWREGTAGGELEHPCHLVAVDGAEGTDPVFADSATGEPVALPLSHDGCTDLGEPGRRYHTIGDLAVDGAGRAVVLLSPVEGSRELVHPGGPPGDGMPRVEPSPGNATEIFFDADDALWAVDEGPVVFVRERGADDWRTVHETDDGACYPRAALDETRRVAYLYTQGCEGGTVDVRRLDLEALRARSGSSD